MFNYCSTNVVLPLVLVERSKFQGEEKNQSKSSSCCACWQTHGCVLECISSEKVYVLEKEDRSSSQEDYFWRELAVTEPKLHDFPPLSGISPLRISKKTVAGERL